MKKLMLAILALILVPTVVFALDFHVDMPHIIAAPNFRYGLENTNNTIGGLVFARDQLYAQSKQNQLRYQDITDTLQRQADENSKKLAEAVANSALQQLELNLRDAATAAGDTVDVKKDTMKWELTYKKVFPSKAYRLDVATVDLTTSKCRVTTQIVPYGISVFGVAQIVKH